MSAQTSSFDYLEQAIKQMLMDLKRRNCLGQDFQFLTKAEQNRTLDSFIDNFIKTDIHPEHLENLSLHP